MKSLGKCGYWLCNKYVKYNRAWKVDGDDRVFCCADHSLLVDLPL